MSQKKRFLTLKEKIEVLEDIEKKKLSLRAAAVLYKIGKSQVSWICKNKQNLYEKWHKGENPKAKKIFIKSAGQNIDQLCLEWFSKARSQNIPLSGEVVKAKAIEIAHQLGENNFKASNGWLEKWRNRHSISFKTISGESAAINPEDANEYKNKLPSLLTGYSPENIFNADESGIFFRALPNKTLHFKGNICSGGKLSKERLSVLFCCNMLGDKLPVLVIGKAAKPRAFKGVSIQNLPVIWKSNKRAWMTSAIMTEWLCELDRKMTRNNRKILLFLDNAASHPRDLKLNSIVLSFLPPNLTSVCQPLDQGVIKNFKFFYRELIVKQMLTKINSGKSQEKLNILDAVFFIKTAWAKVKPNTIQNCFQKAGFRKNDSPIIDSDSDEEENMPLSDLATLLCGTNQICANCNFDDYFNIDENIITEDNDIAININIDLTNEPESEEEIEELPLKVKTVQQALELIDDLKLFASDDFEAYQHLKDLEMHYTKRIVEDKIKNQKQTSILNFFEKSN